MRRLGATAAAPDAPPPPPPPQQQSISKIPPPVPSHGEVLRPPGQPRDDQQSGLSSDADAAMAAAAEAAEAGLGPALDPVSQKLGQIRAGVAELRRQAGSAAEVQEALRTLHRLLANVLGQPGEARFQRVRLANPAFARAAGRFPAALAILEAAGWARTAGDGEGETMVLRRNDPGLLWLVASALEDEIHA